jgi:energy-coupling factor transporter ATP-binding protein EcfA2
MNNLRHITRYFRQSLIDSERICPEDQSILRALKVDIGNAYTKKNNGELLSVGPACWSAGHFSEAETRRIFKAFEKIHGKPSQNEDEEIVLFPRVDLLRSRGGKRNTFKRKVLLPLVVFARVDQNGCLTPTTKEPWIPRIWLAPNEGQNSPIGDYMALDEFLTITPFEAVGNWSELQAYAEDMIEAVTGMPFDQNLHPSYVNSQQAVVLLDPPIVGAKERLIQTYDKIIDGTPPSDLYHAFVSYKDRSQKPLLETGAQLEYAHKHVGQMTGKFPLSPNQRHALHHFIGGQNQGEILAINGPPGTGKTTLISSIVANMWVSSALAETKPPIIVAASNNNQAVTNILESFARIDETVAEADLAGRWLPGIDTYGLYCCPNYKANNRNPYAYIGPNNEGLMATLQDNDYLERAKTHFLRSVSKKYGAKFTNVEKAKNHLLGDLKKTVGRISDGLHKASRLEEIRQRVIDEFGSVDQMLIAYSDLQNQKDTLKSEKDAYRAQLNRLIESWKHRPWWAKINFIKWMLRKAHAQENLQILNQLDITLEATEDDAVQDHFKRKIIGVDQQLGSIETVIHSIEEIKVKYQSCHVTVKRWMAAQGEMNWSDSNVSEKVNEVCDRVLRFKAFKLATHYWEACWLEETCAFVEANDRDTKSPVKIVRKWRRYAKLAPCFVSTFYMISTFFTAWERQDDTWMDIPLFGEIDLLVVDEAGQALTEVAAAGFAFAKRAVVVGDTDQIEPVWGVPASVDRANLRLFGLLDNERREKHYADFWLKSGLLASCGNVMSVAQRQCRFHQFPQLQRGLYLTEHRRCYDSIIGYCNDLVYKGVLEPLRGEPQNGCPWPQMGLVPVNGKSATRGSSRINEQEASTISQWLLKNKQIIAAYARQIDAKLEKLSDNAVLERAVGVVTPFSRQAALIHKQLKNYGIPNLTVGTVHSLQGDERLIVLFSSVYGEGDQSIGKFYDRSHNMLNVAVSRAKDCFLAFSHPDIFGEDGKERPSGRLRKCLQVVQGHL